MLMPASWASNRGPSRGRIARISRPAAQRRIAGARKNRPFCLILQGKRRSASVGVATEERARRDQARQSRARGLALYELLALVDGVHDAPAQFHIEHQHQVRQITVLNVGRPKTAAGHLFG
jgi:hypothetical protein